MLTRRNLLRAAPGVALGLVVADSTIARAALSSTGTLPLPQLDPVITSAALRSITALYRKVKNGTQSAPDVATAQTALTILFAYMEEQGYNKMLQSTLPARAQAVLSNGVDPGRLQAIQTELAQAGISITEDQTVNIFGSAQNQAKSLISRLGSIRIEGIEQNLVTQLASFTPVDAPKGLPTAYHPGRPHAHFERVASCAALAIECGILGLLSPPPLDAVMAAAAVTYDLLAAAGLC